MYIIEDRKGNSQRPDGGLVIVMERGNQKQGKAARDRGFLHSLLLSSAYRKRNAAETIGGERSGLPIYVFMSASA